MKKTLLTLVIMAFAAVSFAQTSSKPTEGDLLTEVNFNLASFADNFELPNLKFRYFVADDLVASVELGVQGGKTTSDIYENADGTGKTGTEEMKASGFSIGLGVEKHFAGTNRLSPYMGCGLGFASGSSNNTYTDADGTGSFVDGLTLTEESKNSAFGAGVSLGADYWFGENFYLGSELGFGFGMSTTGDMTTETSFGGSTSKAVMGGGKSSAFGDGIMPSFRLGWKLK